MSTSLASERVIINSPMSFAGSAQRSWRILPSAGWQRWALAPVATILMLGWWIVVAAWYIISVGLLGIITIPYRILRRGARKRKAEARRHREMMEAVDRQR